MRLVYYDEAGDDGYPDYSSPMFVLSCVYVQQVYWKQVYKAFIDFRKTLKVEIGLPVKFEFHTKQFLLNKHPYKDLNISDSDRVRTISLLLDFLINQPIQIINVVINKENAKKQNRENYDVLENAFTYSIQRIENALLADNNSKILNKVFKILEDNSNTETHLNLCEQIKAGLNMPERFFIITDEGRLGKMRRTARKIQAINYIPSKYDFGSFKKEIKLLVEDPISKKSNESYFIQIADLISSIVYLYCLDSLKLGKYANRLPSEITPERVKEWMNMLKPIFNLKASSNNAYGLVCYPK